MISKNREYRAFEPVLKEDLIVEGMPVVFNQPTIMFQDGDIKYYEVIDRHAFDNARMDDVVFVENHSGTPAARTKNKTLELNILNEGLHQRADLSTSSIGPAMHQNIKNKIYDKMSFSFTVRRDSYDRLTRTRTILEIDRLYDVSVVTFAAYEQTNVSARSFFDVEAEKERMEMRELELKKRKLKLRIELEKEN